MVTENFKAAYDIRKGRCVSLSSDPLGGIEETRYKDTLSTSKIIGIASKDIRAGFSGNVVVSGIVDMKNVWSFSKLNEVIYVWDYGLLSQEMPQRLIVPIGYAIAKDTIYLKIPDFVVMK